MPTKLLSENLERSFGLPRHIDGSIILKFTAIKFDVRICDSGYRPVTTHCDLQYESMGCIKSRAISRVSEKTPKFITRSLFQEIC
jgi:hypothetical protein